VNPALRPFEYVLILEKRIALLQHNLLLVGVQKYALELDGMPALAANQQLMALQTNLYTAVSIE